MALTVGEHLMVKKIVKEVFSNSPEIEEVCIKQKYVYYLDLDDINGRTETNDFVHLKIIKKDNENYIIEKNISEKPIKRLYNIHSNILEKI